jgi:4-amino-4-deoxy-L-arabinose transferase-like glycosyltransferase
MREHCLTPGTAWLVKMVGALAAAPGWTLLGAARTRSVDTNIRRLGLLSALGSAIVYPWYGGVRRRISRIYLAEALPELALS